MELTQVAALVNNATKEAIGEEAVLQEDLSNVVDIGEQIMNARSVDKYVRSLVDHIGKVIFVNRAYRGSVPSVLRDGWEYGAVLEKIATVLPEAEENESWELEDGVSYDPNVFKKPTVIAKFFNRKTTFDIQLSFTEMQARGSFSSASQMNGFISMLFTSVDNSSTVKYSELIMRTINNMIGGTFYDLTSNGGNVYDGNARCVNLLKLYNERFTSATLTAETCIDDPAFIRYAVFIMSLYETRMRRMSKLFNVGGQPRFTPSDRLHFVLLDVVAKAADVFLQSNTFHDEFTKLPKAELVPYWQGSGLDYGFDSITSIDIKVATGDSENPSAAVSQSGIIGVMFDHDALGVNNEERRVTTNWNPKAEFYNNWYKYEMNFFNDFNENFIVFYVADET